jgi:hypothetical protein
MTNPVFNENNLKNGEILSSTEAAEIWKLNSAYVRNSLVQNPEKWSENGYKKVKGIIIVTSEEMENITGKSDPRKVNAIQSPDGIEMTYDQKDTVYKNAKTRAFQKCNKLDGGNRDNLNAHFQESLKEILDEIVQNKNEEAHHLHVVTDTASISVDVDGEEILISNGGVDGSTDVYVIEEMNADSDWAENEDGGRIKTDMLEGNEIAVHGLPLELSGKFQCWAQVNGDSANIWIVKQS